jgi:hypothetical protein
MCIARGPWSPLRSDGASKALPSLAGKMTPGASQRVTTREAGREPNERMMSGGSEQ